MRRSTIILIGFMAMGSADVAAAPPFPPSDEIAQTRAAEERRREERRERRLREEREERRDAREREARERHRRWREERRERHERATEELRERREEEVHDRYRRMEEGYETQEERRERARRQRRLHSDEGTLRMLFPSEWIPGIVAGRVETGWNANAVIASQGKPNRITRPAEDTEHWHYPDKTVILFKDKVRAVRSAPARAGPQAPQGNQ